jgi:hypothetical protein
MSNGCPIDPNAAISVLCPEIAECLGPFLSTGISTGIQPTLSAVASLSTSVSTGLVNTNSAVSSLSTSVSTGLVNTNSAIASLSTGANTLSTSVSSGLSVVNSAVASLSTNSVVVNTNLSTVSSAVASLSTIVATKADLVGGTVPASQLPSFVDDVLEGTLVSPTVFNDPSNVPYIPVAGKIYTDTTTNFTYRWSGTQYVRLGGDYAVTTKDEGTILTTATTEYNFTGGGVTATNSGGMVTVNIPGVIPTLPVSGTTPPSGPPAIGASPWYFDTTLNEVWLWDGIGWRLIKGHTIDTVGALGLISIGPGLLIYSYVVPRDALISLSSQVSMSFFVEPIGPIYVQTNLTLSLNGSPLAAQSTHTDGQYGVGDGWRSSVAYAVGSFSAGDIIQSRISLSTTQLGMIINVNTASFQAMFEG